MLVYLFLSFPGAAIISAFHVSVSTSPSGLEPQPAGGGTYSYGETITVTAQSVADYTFMRWTENGVWVSSYPNYQFTVTGNRNLVAEYAKPSLTLSPGSGTAGSTITVSGTAFDVFAVEFAQASISFDNIIVNQSIFIGSDGSFTAAFIIPSDASPGIHRIFASGPKNNATAELEVLPFSGTLSVNTTPVSGSISVDGKYEGTGSWTGTISTGIHTISFGSVTGYTTPESQTITIYQDQIQTVTGTYTQDTGTLSIMTTPVRGGITVDGNYIGTGSWTGPLSTGSHTISFDSVTGYLTPEPMTVNLYKDQTIRVTGTYIPDIGTLSVTTVPVNGSIRVDGTYKGTGSWTGTLSPGSHTISFDSVTGYSTPESQTVYLFKDQTIKVTGTYIQDTGTLSVTTAPVSGSITVDGIYRGTGSWTGRLSTGGHTVTFGPVTGYSAPQSITITIDKNSTTTISQTYTFEWDVIIGIFIIILAAGIILKYSNLKNQKPLHTQINIETRGGIVSVYKPELRQYAINMEIRGGMRRL